MDIKDFKFPVVEGWHFVPEVACAVPGVISYFRVLDGLQISFDVGCNGLHISIAIVPSLFKQSNPEQYIAEHSKSILSAFLPGKSIQSLISPDPYKMQHFLCTFDFQNN